jgi:hypothetical protein
MILILLKEVSDEKSETVMAYRPVVPLKILKLWRRDSTVFETDRQPLRRRRESTVMDLSLICSLYIYISDRSIWIFDRVFLKSVLKCRD